MGRTVSIRQSMLVNLVVVIALLSAGIIGTTVLGARLAVRTLSEALISRALDQMEARLEQFFDPVVGGLGVVRAWGEAGLLDLDEPEELTALLIPLMEQYPQVSSIMVADGRGREHMVLRTGDRWQSRQTRRDEWGDRTRWREWTDGWAASEVTWSELDYDPRRRPWYVGAIEQRSAHGAAAGDAGRLTHWTEPYTFFTTGDPGITASLTYDPVGEEESLDHVVGFDVELDEITDFTIGLRPSANGVAFVIDELGQLIGLPRLEAFADPTRRREAMLRQPDELDHAVMQDGTRAYFAQPEERRGAYRFVSEGRPWWAGARGFQLGPETALLIVVGVPEVDLLGSLQRMRVWMIVITVGVLGGAIWRAVVLAQRYSRPIEALVVESERISRGDLDPGEPIVSGVREVHKLAEAHEQMRVGIGALMKLERDLQLARQIQERTFPNRLPALEGFQIDAWSEPAEETGGDTYDVVGYQSAPAGTPIVVTVEDADRAVLLMADATGHGIGPALSVTQVRAMLRMAVRAHEDLATIATHLNEQLCADLPEGRFITAWLGKLNAADHSLTSFSAGQAPILYYDAPSDHVEVLEADVPPLGVTRTLDVEVAEPRRLSSGDIVAVISDGIFEATDSAGRQFGTAGVVDVITAYRRRSPKKIIEALREAVELFTGGAAASDDRTGIIIKRP